jgi:hypothetical protein
VYFLSSAGRSACIDVGLFEAFSCSWPSSSTFCKLREIARLLLACRHATRQERGKVLGRLPRGPQHVPDEEDPVGEFSTHLERH